MMIPCVSEVCSLPSTFEQNVTGFASGGCHVMEGWLTKIEKHLETNSISDTQKLLNDNGLSVPVASYQGGLLLSQGDGRTVTYDHFKRRLEMSQALGIKTINILADFAQPVDAPTLGKAVHSLAEAARWAAGFEITLGLEFRGGDTFCTCLETALAMIHQCGEPNVGVCLDWFHFYKGPSKMRDLDALTNQNLAHVQLCDVPGIPRELMTDSDRVLPGEGDFHLDALLDRLKEIGYNKTISVEVMNPVIWRTKPHQIAELALASLVRHLQ